jgi:hypothetical protein
VTLPKRAVREIERVLRVARRVIGGGAQGVETVILGLDLGALDHGEAGLAEDAAHLLAHEGERMGGARPGVGRRERGVDGRPELRGDLGVADALQRGVELGRELRLGLVDELAHGGALLLGHGAHLLHQRGEFTVGADIAGLGGLEVGARLEGRELGRGLGEEGGEGGLHQEILDRMNKIDRIRTEDSQTSDRRETSF